MLIEKSGLSVADVAVKAHLTPPVLYAWLKEQGRRPPHRENVERVAMVLGSTYSELWGEAPITATERTRLMQLESAVQRMQQLLDEIRPEPLEPEPEGDAIARAPDVTYHEDGGDVRAVPRRRRAKGA